MPGYGKVARCSARIFRASQKFGLPIKALFCQPVNRIPTIPEAVPTGHESGALQFAVNLAVEVRVYRPALLQV
jgi:hypothetical protein